ncbi:MAG: MFS transporter [Clostridia bacterium]
MSQSNNGLENASLADTVKAQRGGIFNKLAHMIKAIYIDVTSHWLKPAKGNYVSYKEIAAYSLGGFGQQLILPFLAYFSLSATSTLLGATIGLQPVHLQLMLMIQQVFGLLFSIVRGQLVDNTRSKYGRFRPYIGLMGFPIVFIAIIFVFLPFEQLGYTTKLILAFVFSTLCVYPSGALAPLYFDSYNELRTVISPNSKERGKVIAISAIAYSLAPTIYYSAIPLLSNFTGGLTNIATYKWVVVPFALVGVVFGLFAAIGTKERIIVPKTYVPKVNLVTGIKDIYKNKYWVLRTVSTLLTFLRTANIFILTWMFIYDLQDMVLMGILNPVLGTASGLAMFLSPLLLNKLGSQKAYILKEFLPIIFSVFVLLFLKNFVLFFIFYYLNTFVLAFNVIIDPVIHGEIKDYQQYISGKRMDFTLGTAGSLFLPITLASGLLIPFIYESQGITKNYDILYDPMVREQIFYIVASVSILGSILAFIPIIFYNLTKGKYDNIVKVLKLRAMFEDYINGDLSPESVKNGVEIVREAKTYAAMPMADLKTLKREVLFAKKGERKAAFKEYIENRNLSEQIEGSHILIDELHKYDSPQMIANANIAERIVLIGLNNETSIDIGGFLIEAQALPAHTAKEKSYRKKRIAQAKALIKMHESIAKYPHGLAEADYTRLDTLNNTEAQTAAEKKEKRKKINALYKEFARYDKLVAVYLDAKKFLNMRVAYSRFDEIADGYDDACKAYATLKAQEEEQDRLQKEQQKAEIERLKREKLARKKHKKPTIGRENDKK